MATHIGYLLECLSILALPACFLRTRQCLRLFLRLPYKSQPSCLAGSTFPLCSLAHSATAPCLLCSALHAPTGLALCTPCLFHTRANPSSPNHSVHPVPPHPAPPPWTRRLARPLAVTDFVHCQELCFLCALAVLTTLLHICFRAASQLSPQAHQARLVHVAAGCPRMRVAEEDRWVGPISAANSQQHRPACFGKAWLNGCARVHAAGWSLYTVSCPRGTCSPGRVPAGSWEGCRSPKAAAELPAGCRQKGW